MYPMSLFLFVFFLLLLLMSFHMEIFPALCSNIPKFHWLPIRRQLKLMLQGCCHLSCLCMWVITALRGNLLKSPYCSWSKCYYHDVSTWNNLGNNLLHFFPIFKLHVFLCTHWNLYEAMTWVICELLWLCWAESNTFAMDSCQSLYIKHQPTTNHEGRRNTEGKVYTE